MKGLDMYMDYLDKHSTDWHSQGADQTREWADTCNLNKAWADTRMAQVVLDIRPNTSKEGTLVLGQA